MINAGTPVANTAGFPRVRIDDDGVAVIQGVFGNNAAATLKSGTAKIVQWSRDANGTWTCSTTADAKYAPSGCPGGATITALTVAGGNT